MYFIIIWPIVFSIVGIIAMLIGTRSKNKEEFLSGQGKLMLILGFLMLLVGLIPFVTFLPKFG